VKEYTVTSEEDAVCLFLFLINRCYGNNQEHGGDCDGDDSSCDGDDCGDIQTIIKTTANEMTNKTKTYVKKSHLMLNTDGL
jgi:hypothetical protein